jgi:hypothetical protein
VKTYMVGYDLNRPHKDYPDLIAAIKKYGTYWHHLDSTWLIKTNESAVQIRDKLRVHIDDNDELLVAALTGESAWAGFDDKGSQWLNDNILPS